MAIIRVSRGSFSHGAEVAERVAGRLGYACISREVLLDAGERFHIPEIKLVQAIHDSPNILQRFQFGKQAYIAYIQYALTQRVRSGRSVYHGFAGHLLLPGIPHVLKVRILASMDQRVATKMAQARMAEREALAVLEKDDEERRKWSKALYGVDPQDSNLYDLVIRLDKLAMDEAVELICLAASSPAFEVTEAARQLMDDLAKACEVKARLIDQVGDIGVTCEFGNVLIYAKGGDKQADRIRKAINSRREELADIANLEIRTAGPIPNHAL